MYQTLTAILFLLLLINSRSGLSAAELTLTAFADTSVHENAPDNNMGGNGFVSAGSNGALSPARALFQFDLAGIASGSTIVNVQLGLSVTGLPFSSAADSVFALHRLRQSWGEGQGIGQAWLARPRRRGDVECAILPRSSLECAWRRSAGGFCICGKQHCRDQRPWRLHFPVHGDPYF